MSRGPLSTQASAVGLLADPARRALYAYVTAQPEPVSRTDAATAVDLPPHTAKFHLDKLVDEGLLDVRFERRTGRSGPGAGRPAKLYLRSTRQIDVSLPRRAYDLAGQILATAVSTSADHGTPVLDAVHDAANAAGRTLANHHATGPDTASVRTLLQGVGYEPRPDETGDGLLLGSCPFHSLIEQHTTLVCTMNLALLDGVVDAAGCTSLCARLDPAPGRCCVTLAPPMLDGDRPAP